MKIKVQRKGKKKIEVLTHRSGGGHNRNQRSTERPVGVHLSLSLSLSPICVLSQFQILWFFTLNSIIFCLIYLFHMIYFYLRMQFCHIIWFIYGD